MCEEEGPVPAHLSANGVRRYQLKAKLSMKNNAHFAKDLLSRTLDQLEFLRANAIYSYVFLTPLSFP